MTADRAGRRRGAVLEEAILEATWAELNEGGYLALTLEAVAERAGTSRPVLSRRWPTRSALATAALARQWALNPSVVPDLGNLRDETCELLRRMSARVRPDLIQLIFEMQADLADARSSYARIKPQVVGHDAMAAILQRAITRGEVDPARLTPRLAALPTDLARNEILMTFEPLSQQSIEEIVEQVFLPLVQRARPD